MTFKTKQVRWLCLSRRYGMCTNSAGKRVEALAASGGICPLDVYRGQCVWEARFVGVVMKSSRGLTLAAQAAMRGRIVMANDLVPVPRRELLNVDGTFKLAEVMAKSGFFTDARDAAQAVVKVLAGAEMGFGPVSSMTGVNIIKGKVSIGANLMAAAVRRSGLRLSRKAPRRSAVRDRLPHGRQGHRHVRLQH